VGTFGVAPVFVLIDFLFMRLIVSASDGPASPYRHRHDDHVRNEVGLRQGSAHNLLLAQDAHGNNRFIGRPFPER
jgi:hypothetical protein